MDIIRKIMLCLVLSFFPYIAHAATTDCVQTSSTGTVDCVAPLPGAWQNSSGQHFNDFDTLAGVEVGNICSRYGPGYAYSCVNKTDVSTPPGLPCSASPTVCAYYTHILGYNSGNNGITAVLIEQISPHQYDIDYDWELYRPLCSNSYSAVHYDSANPILTLCSPPTNNTTAQFNISKSTGCPTCDALSGSGSLPFHMPPTQISVGGPVNIGTGNHYEVEADFSYNSTSPIYFNRYYNSQIQNWTNNLQRSINLVTTTQGTYATLNLSNGQGITFINHSGTWSATSANVVGTLTTTTSGFTYQSPEGNTEYYDTTGRLVQEVMLGGQTLTYGYGTTGLLSKVSDQYGNVLNVTLSSPTYCNSALVITGLSFVPYGSTTSLNYSYTYGTSCRITQVTYPDTTYKQYTYSGNYMSTMVDENLNTYQNWTNTYNSTVGTYQTTQTSYGSSANINKYTFTYNSTNTVMVDGLGNSNTINFTFPNGVAQTLGSSTICEDCNGLQANSTTYDTEGNLTASTDFNGNQTQYTFNLGDPLHQDLPLTVTEAVGSSVQRSTSFTYEPTFRLPYTVTEPVTLSNGTTSSRTTTYSYDTNGNVTGLSIVAPNNDGTSNTTTKNWTLAYNTNNQLTSITDPLTHSVSYTYSPTGQVATITNSLNQTITFSNYDNYGNAQNVAFPDGTTLALTYNQRGNVLSKNYQGQTMSFTYDNAQQLTQLTYPSGNYNTMVYDSAHRLTTVKEYDEHGTYLGDTVFTLDAMSNMTAVNIYDASNNQIRTSTAQYDSKNRLYKIIGSLNQTTTFTYDPNSNIKQITDGRNHNINKTYDALNRLATYTAQDGGQTTLTYDAQDNLTNVNDPKNLNTGYVYDGFNNLISQSSPDTGTTTYSYDLNGNTIGKTDAKGQASTYTYDNLDKLINVSYAGHSAEAVSLTYDSCTNGIGKICSIVDKTGTLNYRYDVNGRLASKEFISPGATIDLTTGYSYNTAGQMTNVTYPSGMIVNYSYSDDKIVGISYTVSGTTNTVLNNGVYQPFNQDISSYTWGNGATYAKTFNLDGMISAITSANAPTTNKTYAFDNNYNITAINDPVTPSLNASATYDLNNRVATYSYNSGSHSYNFNTSSDLTSKIDNTVTTTFNYASGSHQLNSLSGGQTDTITTDANGDVTGFSGNTLTYDAKNRLTTLNNGTLTTTYSVNYLGERTGKTNSTNTSYFMYDTSGALIGDYDASGNTQDEYIYLNGNVVGLIQNGNLYYVYDDHLGTPRAITDTSNNLQWTWENAESFGNNQPTSVVSGFTFNFRFPGQYFDNESNLSYNLHRDYNPNWGRYVESDPIGLAGGLNTYTYVDGNALSNFDNSGLDVIPSINGNTLTITIPIGILGTLSESSKDGSKGVLVANEMEERANKFWNQQQWQYGKCNINIHFIVKYNQNSLNNALVFDDLQDPSIYPSAVIFYRGHYNFGRFYLKDVRQGSGFDPTPAYVHEFGHFMGLPDEYDKTTQRPLPGWNNNIMAQVPGIVQQKNIDMLVKLHFNSEQLNQCSCNR
jgi:RHS repeat-associated protein